LIEPEGELDEPIGSNCINEQFAAGWAFALPSSFKAGYSFARGDVLYDTPLAYQIWSEALRHITTCLEVTVAASSGAQSSGMVCFLVSRPDAIRSKLVKGREYSGSQAEFVQMLRSGFWKEVHHSAL
jgi:hypothetical protein